MSRTLYPRLQKRHNQIASNFQRSNEEEQLVQDCRGKTFIEFNNLIGLPKKNDIEYPIFDYEKDIIRSYRNNQHTWIKKARGLGVTTITLRYLAWECLSTNRLQGKSIFIVSGTREEFANLLKEKLAGLFHRRYPNLQLASKYTELTLNKTWIKVFPTQAVKDLRGHTDVAYIFIDEADFFERIEQEELEAVITAYEEKSKAKIIMVSTPWLPDGLFQKIENNEIFKDTFNKMFLDYTKGLDRIYDSDFIRRKMNEPFFAAPEYNLQYAGRIGNIFAQSAIDRCVQPLDNLRPMTEKYMAVDIGYISSKFAIIIAEREAKLDKIRILKAEEIPNAQEPEMMERILGYYKEYKNIKNIAVDATSRQPFVTELKNRLEDYPSDWNRVHKKMQDYKSKGKDLARSMKVVPVLFNTETKAIMTAHARQLIEDPDSLLAIDPMFKELIIFLRAAIFDERGQLDKQNTPHNDIGDAFLMVTTFFNITEEYKHEKDLYAAQ